MQPTINKYLVEKHFSLNAHRYDEVTPIQCDMAKRLIHMIRNHSLNYPVKSILELGCGTGRLTRLLLQQFPDCKIVAIDISREMIKQASISLPTEANVELIAGDAEALAHDKTIRSRKYDLVVSNATTQWFTNPLATVKQYHATLSENGAMAFSTFGPDTFIELRQAFRRAEQNLGISRMNHILSFVTPDDWRTLIDGFPNRRFLVKENHHIEAFTTVRKFLYTIKKAGATNPFPQVSSFMSPTLYRRMVHEYEKYQSSLGHGKINATFHIVYGLSYPGF